MSNIETSVQKKRGFVLPAAAVVAVCLFISLVPLPHSEVIGYEVELTGVSAEQAANPDLLEAAFVKAGYESVKVDRTTDNGQTVYRLENVPRRTDAYAMAAAATMLSGGVIMPKVTAIASEGRATLLAQATSRDKEEENQPVRIKLKEGSFFIDLDSITSDGWTATESNSELKIRIAEILKSMGIEDGVGITAQTGGSNSTQAYIIMVKPAGISDSLIENLKIELDGVERIVAASLNPDGVPDSAQAYLHVDYFEGDHENSALIIIKVPVKK